MVGLFLGAGFAKWAVDLPLVNNLFDFKISNIRSGDERWFNKISEEKDQWDSKNSNSGNEEFIYSIITGKRTRLKNYLSKYISRRLSEPFLCNTYGSIQTLMYNDKKAGEIDGIQKAKHFLGSIGLKNIYGIITTNYDLIVEYSLGTNNFNFGRKHEKVEGRGHNPLFPWQNTPITLDGDIILSKIHGSIAFDGERYWSSGICGLNGRAYFVPPFPEKNMDVKFRTEWEYAKDILNNVSELIIFGFNFNEYDTAVLQLLKTNQRNIDKVHIYDIQSKLDKASKIWDIKKIKEHNITHIPPIYTHQGSLFE